MEPDLYNVDTCIGHCACSPAFTCDGQVMSPPRVVVTVNLPSQRLPQAKLLKRRPHTCKRESCSLLPLQDMFAEVDDFLKELDGGAGSSTK